jgi:hypothetical protein
MSTGCTAHFYFRRLAFSTPSSLRHKVLLLGRGYQAHAYTLQKTTMAIEMRRRKKMCCAVLFTDGAHIGFDVEGQHQLNVGKRSMELMR